MALMNCKGCGAKVSDRARYCIHCKTPTAGGSQENAYIPQEHTPPQAPSFHSNVEPPKKKRTGVLIGVIIGVLVLLAAALLVYIFYFDGFSSREPSAANEPSNQAEAAIPPAQDEPEETSSPASTPDLPLEDATNNEIAAFLEEHHESIYDIATMMREGLGEDGRVEITAGTGNELIYKFFYGREFASEGLTDTILSTLESMGPLFEILADSFRAELDLPYMQVIIYYYDYAGNVLVRESFDSAP